MTFPDTNSIRTLELEKRTQFAIQKMPLFLSLTPSPTGQNTGCQLIKQK